MTKRRYLSVQDFSVERLYLPGTDAENLGELWIAFFIRGIATPSVGAF
jgi:hypothetical protein